MNNTIAQLQSNRKFEKLLDLFQEIAPQNKSVQKQILNPAAQIHRARNKGAMYFLLRNPGKYK